MLTLRGINATPFQVFRTPIDQGLIKISLNYRASIKWWTIDIEFESFNVKGMRVCSSYNLLEQYSNSIPFGLLVRIEDGTEPLYIDDFSSGRVTLNILSQSEVDQVDDAYKALRVI